VSAGEVDRMAVATDLLGAHEAIREPTTFRLLGLDWDLLPGVYAPNLTPSAALYAEWLSYPLGGSFCEVGCGTGYVAVLAALRGCARVAALDIDAAAVENTRLNAERHGVDDRVEAACGDMFEPLAEDDRFDVIFWNSNFVEVTDERRPASALERAFFDPGYAAHRAFLAGARAHLEPGGRLLLAFSTLGSAETLDELADELGWRARVARAAPSLTWHGPVDFQLLELDDGRAAG
jgi:release factor glutamine methyltransferase